MNGIVKGYSNYIRFLASPSPTRDSSCLAQAVLQIDFSGPFNRARFTLDYDKPRLWTFDVSDSSSGDGYGGDNGTTSNMAETQIFNRQLRIYGNSLPGYLDAVIDGGLLLKVGRHFIYFLLLKVGRHFIYFLLLQVGRHFIYLYCSMLGAILFIFTAHCWSPFYYFIERFI